MNKSFYKDQPGVTGCLTETENDVRRHLVCVNAWMSNEELRDFIVKRYNANVDSRNADGQVLEYGKIQLLSKANRSDTLIPSVRNRGRQGR